MQFKNIIITLAAVAVGVEGAVYDACKCHDRNTGLQNDWATERACNEYRDDIPARVKYYPDNHHACKPDTSVSDGDLIDNWLFDLKCWRQGEQFYQYCWGKKGPFDKQ
ncbi:hypothetical protein Slin14017_G087000 [Septoria linicola]|nr:hypothetical protein Slin14017_G087000 [Septoria linicola]